MRPISSCIIMGKVLITGATGIVGRHLIKKLIDLNYSVNILSRNPDACLFNFNVHIYKWDIKKRYIDQGAFDEVKHIIHLAGANIGNKRWTEKRKAEIIDSRVISTQLIFNEIIKKNIKPDTFISASAIGYYGAVTSDKIFTETDPPANSFLAKTCNLWEQAIDRFRELGIRTVKIRTGVVLAANGGALSKMITPVKLGIGSAIGNGQQYIPWIHIDDLCAIYIMALENTKMQGVYNAVSTDHKTNKEFIQIIAHTLKKPLWFPDIPEILIKIQFGEMSDIILKGSRVSSEKIVSLGYKFQFSLLEDALRNLLISVFRRDT